MKSLFSRGFREEKQFFTYFCFEFEVEILTGGAPLEEEAAVQKSGRSEYGKAVNWWLEAATVWKLLAAGSRGETGGVGTGTSRVFCGYEIPAVNRGKSDQKLGKTKWAD